MDLKAAKAKGLLDTLRKAVESGFMSMIAIAPPLGRMRYASNRISLYTSMHVCIIGHSWNNEDTVDNYDDNDDHRAESLHAIKVTI